MPTKLLFFVFISLLLTQPISARVAMLKETQISREKEPKPPIKNSQTISVSIEDVQINPGPAHYDNGVIYIEEGGSASISLYVRLTKNANQATGLGYLRTYMLTDPEDDYPLSIGSDTAVFDGWVDIHEVALIIPINADSFQETEGSIFVEYESSSGSLYRSNKLKVIVQDTDQDGSSSSGSSSSSSSSGSSGGTNYNPSIPGNTGILKDIQVDVPKQLAYLTYGGEFPYFSVRGSLFSGILRRYKTYSFCLPMEVQKACDLNVAKSHSSTTQHGDGYGKGGPGFGIFVRKLNTHSDTHKNTSYRLTRPSGIGTGRLCLQSTVQVSAKNRRRGWYEDEQEIYVTCPLEFLETQDDISYDLSPVVRCSGSTLASSPNLIGEFYDGGSYSVSGTPIVSRRWVMQGINGYAQADQYSGAGPITATLFGGNSTSAEIRATLTVTDELGNSGSKTCSVRR